MEPAVLTWGNLSEEARGPALAVTCPPASPGLPITVSVAGLYGERRVVLESTEVHELRLWDVPPFSDEVLILSTDRTWQEPGGERQLGVRLLPGEIEDR